MTNNTSCKLFNKKCPLELNVEYKSPNELIYPKIITNKAICLSGGGSRAFVSGLSHLIYLEQNNLINNYDAIGSVSGGTWANVNYHYGNYENRDDFLGTTLQPENINTENVDTLSDKCVLICATAKDSLVEKILKAGEWEKIVKKYYLDPFSISSENFFTLNEETLQETLQNQSNLNKNNFITASKNLPFPMFFSTIIGPTDLSPYVKGINWSKTIYEMTPIYSGMYNKKTIEYTNEDKSKKQIIELENFTNTITNDGKLINNKVEINKKFTLLEAATRSSFYMGGTIDSVDLPNFLYYSRNYFNKKKNYSFLFADGCNTDNNAVIPFIQRNISNLFVCVNNPNVKFTPLIQNTYTWDNCPIDQPTAALFGLINNDDVPFALSQTYDFENTQIFKKKNFFDLINIMEKVENKGNGIICNVDVETIENKWYGIPANQKHTLTIFYPNLPVNWYNKLSPDIQNLVNVYNLPYINSRTVNINSTKINLVRSMISFTMEQYKNLL
jgi:hypothetical protein